MGKSKSNYAITGLSGKVGKVFVFRQRGGETIVATPPSHTKAPSASQKAQQERFIRASAYAKNALQDPSLKEDYTAEAKKRRNVSAYNMAMTDYLRAPKIAHIDHSGYTGSATGEKIMIEAGDAFKVIAVKVRIEDHDAPLVEEGSATLVQGKWVYTTTVTNPSLTGDKIIVTATDRPGNNSKKEESL